MNSKLNSNNVSISMYVDKSNISKSKTLPLKTLIEKDHRIVYTWTPDCSVEVCYHCQERFNFINRKHHCRNCGKIFCHKCSDKWIKIPMNIRTVPKENNLMDYKTYLDMFQLSSDEDRVCGKCYNKIFETCSTIFICSFLITYSIIDRIA